MFAILLAFAISCSSDSGKPNEGVGPEVFLFGESPTATAVANESSPIISLSTTPDSPNGPSIGTTPVTAIFETPGLTDLPVEFDPPLFSSDLRTFALGFTDFPHAPGADGLLAAYEALSIDTDMTALQFDDGIPWQEALDGREYAGPYGIELGARVALLPDGHTRYVAISPLNPRRDGLALYRGVGPNEDLSAEWADRHLNDSDVVDAFLAHTEWMIGTFDPDYLAYAIDANLLAARAPQKWPDFLDLAETVYATVKRRHSDLPVFVTMQAEEFHRNPDVQVGVIRALLPFTDLIAVSGYPYTILPHAGALPDNYFSEFADIARDKPFAVAETGWPAEDIPDDGDALIAADEGSQAAYLIWLMDQADDLQARFVTWFFSADMDAYWDDAFALNPNALELRLLRDLGMYDGEGEARSALTEWRRQLERTYSKISD